MSFKSINEIEQFRFDDCIICNMESTGSEVRLTVEALIVKPRNSQNTNFTESYAGTTNIIFENAKVESGVKDGYKYYNADEVLINEVPDTPLSVKEIKDLISTTEGAYLYDIEKQKEEDGKYFYSLCIEFVDETENTMADSYRILISFEKAIFKWEHYMNRVQS